MLECRFFYGPPKVDFIYSNLFREYFIFCNNFIFVQLKFTNSVSNYKNVLIYIIPFYHTKIVIQICDVCGLIIMIYDSEIILFGN